MKQNYLRRILSAAILFLASTLTWAYDFYVDGIYYNFLDEESIEVTNELYDVGSYRGNIVIPSTVAYDDKTYNVTGIGGSAFSNCSRLVSVDIPDGVKSIGYSAFYECPSLTSVNIPNSVTSIDSYAFYDCSALTSIDIPSSVTSIEKWAFYGCSALTSVVIGDGMTRIRSNTFDHCSSLTSVNIPNSVTSIDSYAFYCCSALTSINIPESVKSIGYSAFYGCSSLESVNIPDGVTSIEDQTFSYCSSLTSIVIPDGVKSIGDAAFYDCSALTTINIPDGVRSIGKLSFYGCPLTSIDIPASVMIIEENAFYGCSSSLESITVSEDNLDYDSRKGCNAIIDSYTNTLIVGCKNTIIPDGVKSIGENAFFDCSSLTSIDIPNSVTSIGEDAFSLCYSLITVICRAENVPELKRSGFDYYTEDFEVQRLYVPASALEDYKAADGWRYFETILPIVELDYAQKEGWNTIVLPFSADLETFGEGAKAYAFTGATDGVLSFSPVDHLEAHTPYIIYAPEAQELSLNNFHDTTDPNATTAPSVEQSGVTFRGTYEDIDAPDMQGKYGVTNDGHIMEGTNEASIKAYHAYFEVAAGAEIKAISFGSDDATGIVEIADALQQQDTQYYNLAGQRTQKPQKGVNIVNGKKVLY